MQPKKHPQAHPPAYSEIDPQQTQHGHPGQSHIPVVPVVWQWHRDEEHSRLASARARLRFFSALLAGVGLYFLLLYTLHSHHCRFLLIVPWNRLHVPPEDGTIINCIQLDQRNSNNPALSTDEDSTTLSIDLPLQNSFDSLGFIVRGGYSVGQINFSVGDIPDVRFDLSASWQSEKLPRVTKVCQLEKSSEDPERGTFRAVGVYTPTKWFGFWDGGSLTWDIKVTLPSNLVRLSSLVVTAPDFEIRGSLEQTIFSNVAIDTLSSTVNLDKIHADTIKMRSLHGQIYGNFNVSQSLAISSSNGNIDATVSLFKALSPSSNSRDIMTTLPSIFGNFDFGYCDFFECSSNVSATVAVSTTNGAINIDYTNHPADMGLYSYAQSTNGPIRVLHQPAFEGDFELETTGPKVSLIRPSDSEKDPSGKNRRRTLEIRQDESGHQFKRKSGTIWWSDDSKHDDDRRERGDSTLRTTHGAVELVLL